MKKILTIISAVLLCFSVSAQNDSARLDAGSAVFKRAFTQHISIKGEALEKMPFANLSDAINVWIGGAYTSSDNLIYIVDGNVLSDVNAYSVHDIEEVVYLQHAGALTGTANGQKEIVLVTTRKNKGKLNVRGAEQTFLAHRSGGTTDVYQQYYAGADANYDRFSVGVSANYLRDVSSMMKQEGLDPVTPGHMDRWRLNGNFTWRPDPKNTVEAHVGYVPETMDSAKNYTATGNYITSYILRVHELDRQFNTWARWRGEWLPGLRNDLQAGYIYFTQAARFDYQGHYIGTPNVSNVEDSANLHTRQVFVRDRLSYALHAGGWVIEPAVNASYNFIKEKYREAQATQAGDGTISGTSYSHYSFGNEGEARLWMLTPTLDISYKQIFNIQGGITSNISKSDALHLDPSLPRSVGFASVSIDLLHLDGVSRNNSLKLFGSYARRTFFFENDFYLNDLGGANSSYRYGFSTTGQPGFVFTTVGSGQGTTVLAPFSTPLPKYWIWEAGAQWTALQHRLQIDYNFQRRNFSSLFEVDFGGGLPSYYYLIEWKNAIQRLGISYRILDRGDLSWQSGVNISRVDIKGSTPGFSGVGIHLDNKPSYTGGWVNRVQFHRVSLGLDLLYHFGDIIYSDGTHYSVAKNQDFTLLQNIYAGYRLGLPKQKALELYIDARGLARGGDRSNYLLNPEKYYGVGGKIVI